MRANLDRKVATGLAALTALGVCITVASPALAFPGFGAGAPGKLGQRAVMRRVEGIVHAAQATPEQRTRIYAARDRLLQTLAANRPQRSVRKEIAAAFAADQLDVGRIQQLLREQQARQQAVTNAWVQALREIHATLTPAQRQAVAQHMTARGFRKGRFGRGRFGGGFGQPSGPVAPEAAPQLAPNAAEPPPAVQ